jgi:hypothetical protein
MNLPSPSIHRYRLAIKDEQTLQLAAGAHPVHVTAGYLGANKAAPIIELWCHVDLDAPQTTHRFRVVGTGGLADLDPTTHIGTVIHDLPGGRGVWHVFDLGEVAS